MFRRSSLALFCHYQELFWTRLLAVFVSIVWIACDCAVADVPLNANTESGHKRALLVGVQYEPKPGDAYSALHTEYDIRGLEHVLTSPKYGFASENVVILDQANNTTRAAISAAFDKLIESTEPGDVVYFHFSGHGSEVPDETRHKLRGMSQTIIPSDFHVSPRDDVLQIRDLELREWIKRLLARKPAFVTMSFDCCHSGGNTRGARTARGFPYAKKLIENRSREATAVDTGVADAKNLAVLAACRADLSAYEVETDDSHVMGLFSYSLIEALDGEVTPATTYEDLVEQIQTNMIAMDGSGQTAQLIGSANSAVMSGKVVKSEPALFIRKNADGAWTLPAGELHGVTVGSRYALYPAGVKDLSLAPAVGEATVSSVDFTSAQLAVEQDPKSVCKGSMVLKVEEVEHVYPDARPLRVFVDGVGAGELAHNLFDHKEVVLVYAPGESWDVKLTKDTDGKLVLLNDVGMKLSSSAKPVIRHSGGERIGRGEPELTTAIEGYQRWRTIKALRNEDARAVAVELRVVPVEVLSFDSAGYPLKTRDKLPIPGGNVSLSRGDYFELEIRNVGSENAFVSVVDLQSDGTIAVLYPPPNSEKIADNQIRADGGSDPQWHRIRTPETGKVYTIRVREPFGADLIKVIATDEPTSFACLDTNFQGDRKALARAAPQPIQRLFLRSGIGDMRGIEVVASPTSWSTAEVVLNTSDK